MQRKLRGVDRDACAVTSVSLPVLEFGFGSKVESDPSHSDEAPPFSIQGVKSKLTSAIGILISEIDGY